jgi:hypothetical protein
MKKFLLVNNFVMVIFAGVVNSVGQLAGNNISGRLDLISLSPYTIAAYINDHPKAELRILWRRVGINKANLAARARDRSASSAEQFLTDCSGCAAATFAYELDGKPVNEVLLKISDRLADVCCYLIFRKLELANGVLSWRW